jgi:hypothetical protein
LCSTIIETVWKGIAIRNEYSEMAEEVPESK